MSAENLDAGSLQGLKNAKTVNCMRFFNTKRKLHDPATPLQRARCRVVAGSLQGRCRVVAGCSHQLKICKNCCFFAVFDIELEHDGSATTLQQARCRAVAGSLQGRCRVVVGSLQDWSSHLKTFKNLRFFAVFQVFLPT